MKNIPAQMQTDLDGRATKHCYCWLVERQDGVNLGFTDHDRDLEFLSTTFKASTGLDPSAISLSRNLNIDDMDAIGALSDDSITDADISAGLYDGAIVTVFKIDWQDTANRIILLKGPIGTISRGRIGYKAQVKSLSAYADQAVGYTYLPKCRWTLGEGPCGEGVDLETTDYRNTGATVSAAINNRVFECTTSGVLARSEDFFQNGLITWTSGDNDTYRMHVRRNKITATVARFELFQNMPKDIQIGDTFTAYAGCPKTAEKCYSKFNNIRYFGGFNRMPLNDFILSYANKRKRNDGGSLY